MGNTVSAAQNTATSLTSLAISGDNGSMLDASTLPPNHHSESPITIKSPPVECPMHEKQAPVAPPAECPMHQKAVETPQKCPVQHDKMAEVSPPPTKAHFIPPGSVIPSECPMHQEQQQQEVRIVVT